MSDANYLKISSLFRQKAFAYLMATLLIAVFTSSCGVVDKVRDLLDSISDGAACDEDYTCFGQRCLTRADGFPGGYCTTLECDTRGCSGFASECFRTQVDGQNVAACYEMCEFDGTCKRAREGYTCVSLEDVQVCLPPGVSTGIAQGAIGSSCTNDLQCGEGGTCLTNLFGGYCTKLACNGSATCADKSTCVLLNPEEENPTDQVTGCLATCTSSKDCRFGYSCQTYEGSNVCLEGEDTEEPRNPEGKDDGAKCVANINCKGGTCIREVEGAEGQVSFPDGYCTTRGCKDNDDCHGNSVCVSRQRSTVCMESCTENKDCRNGYQCKSGIEGNKFCDSIVEYTAPDTSGAAVDPFDVQCGTSKALKFTVPQGAIGFYIAPFTEDGRRINLTTLELPDNTVLNIREDYGFAAVNSEILETLSPILFPASDQTNLKNRFGGGNYTLNVETSSSKICYYVIPKMKPGTKLDVTVYLVGVRGVTAATAPSNSNMQTVVKTMQSIYSSMGITARVANYVDPSQATLDSYSLLRDINDIFTLVATSQAQGTTPEDSLAVNVFLINDFAVSEVPGLLGVSAGLPGMAGVHGNSGSGLVFSTASLGRDNEMLGLTMAHEIGHFLGLRHTTEHGGSAQDPITDTPKCPLPDLGYICPDAKNFMFPFSLGKDQRQTTRGQSFVLQRSPLVK